MRRSRHIAGGVGWAEDGPAGRGYIVARHKSHVARDLRLAYCLDCCIIRYMG